MKKFSCGVLALIAIFGVASCNTPNVAITDTTAVATDTVATDTVAVADTAVVLK